MEPVELRLGQLLEVEERVVRTVERADDLVELDLNGRAVAVLRVLDQEDHEERDDRGRRVDDELPGVAEAEDRPADDPDDDDEDAARANASGWPVQRAVSFEKRSKNDVRSVTGS